MGGRSPLSYPEFRSLVREALTARKDAEKLGTRGAWNVAEQMQAELEAELTIEDPPDDDDEEFDDDLS
jgi:hypothetical protein